MSTIARTSAATCADDLAGVAWNYSAPRLAEWAMRFLANRLDLWGRYLPLDLLTETVRSDGTVVVDKVRTAPAVAKRGQISLTPARLIRHFSGQCQGHLIGLHAVGADNRSRWTVIEIDQHDETDPAAAETAARLNFDAAQHWIRKLIGLGIEYFLEDSNGLGGLHLWVVFCEPVPGEVAARFGRWLVKDFAAVGFSEAPEVFPKQERVGPGESSEFGNWLRLPGRHHTRAHWSRVWDENMGEWAEGERAISTILATPTNHPSCVPAESQRVPAKPATPAAVKRALSAKKSRAAGERTDAQVALECLAEIPNSDLHYDEWFRVGAAVHHATGGSNDGKAAWLQWSARSGKHSEAVCERTWAALKCSREKVSRVATLIELARRAGFEPYPRRATVEMKPAMPVAVPTPFSVDLPDAPEESPFAVLPNRGGHR